MNRSEITQWLKEEDPVRLEALWKQADEVRRVHVGDDVYLRGLVELSNICARNCGYCGIRCTNRDIERYRMTREEILDTAELVDRYNLGTLVLQAAEDPGLTLDFMTEIISSIKKRTDQAVTLSLGERELEEITAWRKAGADRYLLRFETSNSVLYNKIHPPKAGYSWSRFDILRHLRKTGYEVGSGVLLGIPGQSYDSLTDDLLLFQSLKLDMVGVGPYIPHPDTPLAKDFDAMLLPHGEQVPNTTAMAYKTVALTRILCPDSNIPVTTAVATLDGAGGRVAGLERGGNVIMPNMTPLKYRKLYEIYPSKASSEETADETYHLIVAGIEATGRRVGRGRGDAPSMGGLKN